MDWVTVIASIVVVLSFLYALLFGQRTVPDLIKKFRRKKFIQDSKPTILELTSKTEAIISRKDYSENLLRHARSLFSQTNDENVRQFLLQVFNNDKSFTAPSISADLIPKNSYFIDCICTAVTKEGRTIILLPSGGSEPDIEGVGRTFILLELLGLTFLYGRLIGLGIDDIRSQREIPLHVKSDPWCRLLVSDMAYLGSSGSRLSLIPTKGEQISFIWDLARHIYRTTELEYNTGDHRREPGRQKLCEIFQRIPLEPLINLYGKTEQLYPVDEVIILLRKIGEPSMPVRRELTGQEQFEQLRKSLLVSAQHRSAFWYRDLQELEGHVDNIIRALDPDKIPSISEISYSYPSPVIPNYIFSEITELIKGKKQVMQPEISEEVNIKIGIGVHNDILVRSLYDTDEVRLLVTSGEKIFRDINFWKALSQVKREINLKILMLDPDSPLIEEREKEAYADKPKGFLANEIRENIEIIKRMSSYFMKINKPVNIQCYVYNELPSFRMTFIGKQRLLVASYEKERRTGSETVFYDIIPQQRGELFEGFDREYRRIEALARPQNLPACRGQI